MPEKPLRSCVTPKGTFRFGIHRPAYTVANLRSADFPATLGQFADGSPHHNHKNFPEGDVFEPAADTIYEIANPFPFRGATFIPQSWAETKVKHPERIGLPPPPATSMRGVSAKWLGSELPPARSAALFADLPPAIRLAIAANSTDPEDLIILAAQACELLFTPSHDTPIGLRYRTDEQGRIQPVIHDHTLFEVVVNNQALPDAYKEAMVLRPGVQGESEIVGDWQTPESHVFEYLRRNSYIPWGHYAANMAPDAIRYRVADLVPADMTGLRHLYYQRSFCRLAIDLGLALPAHRRLLQPSELEALRHDILQAIAAAKPATSQFSATLWGWNYGFDCAANGYRLHASHQMIHQQFALLPSTIPSCESGTDQASSGDFSPYGCGNLIHDWILDYAAQTGASFFDNYLAAIHGNTRVDGRQDLASSLIVYEDRHVILFVPKAQVSQWELQLMTVLAVGNILEADHDTRQALDAAILIALRLLTALGAQMVTSIEYPKPFGADTDQHLLYSFLPKLPYAPGAFSEAQLRFICGHYPEDFAQACRGKLFGLQGDGEGLKKKN